MYLKYGYKNINNTFYDLYFKTYYCPNIFTV